MEAEENSEMAYRGETLNKDLFHTLILTQLPIGVVAPYWKAANVLKRDTLARLKI